MFEWYKYSIKIITFMPWSVFFACVLFFSQNIYLPETSILTLYPGGCNIKLGFYQFQIKNICIMNELVTVIHILHSLS